MRASTSVALLALACAAVAFCGSWVTVDRVTDLEKRASSAERAAQVDRDRLHDVVVSEMILKQRLDDAAACRSAR